MRRVTLASRLAALAALLASLGSASAGDEAAPVPPGGLAPPAPPAPAAPPVVGPAGLAYLHVNVQGAEVWWRERDGATVLRVPGGPFLRRPYEGQEATREAVSVEVPAVDR